MEPNSAYVHVPFCAHRCGYCNFSLVANRPDLISAYLDCLERELAETLQSRRTVATIFVGGGTPTLLQVKQTERLLSIIDRWFQLSPGGEYSFEANPLDCTPEKLSLLASAGVNRLSLGGQSFDDRKLKLLERDHTGGQLAEAVELAGQFFDNLSLDLIFAAPDESITEWKSDLATALQLPIKHISTYGLTIERGSLFFGRLIRGQLHEVDELQQLEMYEHTIHTMLHHNWNHYEVSNFSMVGYECRHNMNYWNGQCWWAFGPGAASLLPEFFNDGQPNTDSERRWHLCTNHRSTTEYIKRVQKGLSPVADREVLQVEAWIRNRLVFGLRQLRGVDTGELDLQLGRPIRELFEPYLTEYIQQGWLELSSKRLRLTRAGLVISDSLWPNLLISQNNDKIKGSATSSRSS